MDFYDYENTANFCIKGLTRAIGCVGTTGNVDCDLEDVVDISDLNRLIDYLFITYDQLCCPEEANLDGDSLCVIDIADLTLLIDYLFITGSSLGLPDCL